MIRKLLLGVVTLAFMILVGCGKDSAPRNDMPIKGVEGGVDKKGKPKRTIEASVEESPKAK
jgi:hypothetical protein